MENTKITLLTCVLVVISIATFYATSELNNETLPNNSFNQYVAHGDRIENSISHNYAPRAFASNAIDDKSSELADFEKVHLDKEPTKTYVDFGNKIENSVSHNSTPGSFASNDLDGKSSEFANIQSVQTSYEMLKTDVPNTMLGEMNSGNNTVGVTKRVVPKNTFAANVDANNPYYAQINYKIDNTSESIIQNSTIINIISDNNKNAITHTNHSANSIQPADNYSVNLNSKSNNGMNNNAVSRNESSTTVNAQEHGFMAMTTNLAMNESALTSSNGSQKVGNPGGDPPGDPIPVGDGVWCLLAMALAWGTLKMKQAKSAIH